MLALHSERQRSIEEAIEEEAEAERAPVPWFVAGRVFFSFSMVFEDAVINPNTYYSLLSFILWFEAWNGGREGGWSGGDLEEKTLRAGFFVMHFDQLLFSG